MRPDQTFCRARQMVAALKPGTADEDLVAFDLVRLNDAFCQVEPEAK